MQMRMRNSPRATHLGYGISVKHAVSVIEGFSEFKKWLVREIGFGVGGMLQLPLHQKLSLRLSSWLMVDEYHGQEGTEVLGRRCV